MGKSEIWQDIICKHLSLDIVFAYYDVEKWLRLNALRKNDSSKL